MKQYSNSKGQWRCTLVITLAIVALLSACTREPLGVSGDGQSSVVQVKINLPEQELATLGSKVTEPGSVIENRMDDITILIFDAQGKLETYLFLDLTSASLDATQPKWKSDQILLVPIMKQREPKNIYAVTNWWAGSSIEDSFTETDLKNNILTTNDLSSLGSGNPITMSGSKTGVDLNAVAYSVTVDVERLVAKIRAEITLSIAGQTNNPDIIWLTNEPKIMVGNTPQSTYIINGSFDAPVFLKPESLGFFGEDIMPDSDDQTFPIPSKDLVWKKTGIYVFENLVRGNSSMDKVTYIVVQLPYQNRTTGFTELDNYYKIYINDNQNATSPYTVQRNTIYDFKIGILGLGLPYNDLVADVNIENQLTVIPWEKGGDIDVEIPQNYFNIDRTLVEFQYLTETKKVNIITNVTDWELVERTAENKFGATIFTAADVGGSKTHVVDGIAYSLTGTAANAILLAKKLQNVAPTMPKQQFYFVARNLKVPFTVGYDNGFIPNSVLSKSFTSSVGVLQGWPVYILPLRGLQLAKRGNKKLPHNMAGADDEALEWKTEKTTTSGTELGVGLGTNNTSSMIYASVYPIDHPAAKYCREMGPEWFLPSRNEWLLIYNQLSTLGASYSFYPNHYWSSTEQDVTASWYVYLHNGFTTINAKTMKSRIRCVRYI